MKKQLIAFLKANGWTIRRVPVFVGRFLWFKNFWMPPCFSDEFIYLNKKGKAVPEETAFIKAQKKINKLNLTVL